MKPAAGLILRAADTGRVLLLWGPQGWEFPGGMSQYGEIAQETALRELTEETGYVGGVVFEDAVMVMQLSNGAYVMGSHHVGGVLLYKVFVAKVPSEFEPWLSPEHEDWRWFSSQEMLDNRSRGAMHPGVSEAVAYLTYERPAAPSD